MIECVGLWKQLNRKYVINYKQGGIIIDLGCEIKRKKAQLWSRIIKILIESGELPEYEALDRLLESNYNRDLELAETLINQLENE